MLRRCHPTRRRRRPAGPAAALALAGLAVGACSALTDFSPIDRPDGWVPPDTTPREDAGGDEGTVEAGLFCHSGPSPCPAGTVLVPCGPVVLGSDPGEGDTDEEPEHHVEVSAFCIDAAEVTNANYAACVAAGACTPPGAVNSATRASYYGNSTYDGFAMVNVTWAQSDAYCLWVGKRLPTEAEWEKAARGGCEVQAPTGCGPEDELTYPWGDDVPTCDHANFVGCVADVDRVQARPLGASPYGAQDLTGNVQEWVSDWYNGTAYDVCRAGTCLDPTGPTLGSEKVFRGGHWESVPGYLRAANRFRQSAGFFDPHTGFRCVAPIR
jgi:serine/threonine-protein kinase